MQPCIEGYESDVPLAGFLRFIAGSMFDQQGVDLDCYNIGS